MPYIYYRPAITAACIHVYTIYILNKYTPSDLVNTYLLYITYIIVVNNDIYTNIIDVIAALSTTIIYGSGYFCTKIRRK